VLDSAVDAGLPAGSGKVRVRATQSIISWMSFCWRHPSLTAIEVAWRWLVGVPFLAVLWMRLQDILAAIPPSSAGLDKLSFQNPWTTSVLLADAAGTYRPAVASMLFWLAPIGIVGWAVVSGLGRTLIVWRMLRADSEGERAGSLLRRAPAVMVLQGLWMTALVGCFRVWFEVVGWVAATHITSVTEPDLVGYFCWLIFLSLGLYVVWAVTSWTLAAAPMLVLLEGRSLGDALVRSFRLGRTMPAKLVELNLVLSIVKIMLIVLGMVFCAAPLPFSDQFGPDFMHVLYMVIGIVFLIANDYFAVVRIRSFVGLWRVYRKPDVDLVAG
jgi:hypothetical protein